MVGTDNALYPAAQDLSASTMQCIYLNPGQNISTGLAARNSGAQALIQENRLRETDDNPAEQQGLLLPDLCSAQAVLLIVLITELMALCLILFSDTGDGFDWAGLGRTSLFMQWTALVSAATLCLARGWLARQSLVFGATVAYLVILLICTVFSVAAELLVQQSPIQGAGPESSTILRNLLICGVLAGITLRYFYLQGELRRRQRAELQARIEALHARIRPHFLFNTMNSIASLITEDPEAAERAIEDLSELFRASLRDAGSEVEIDEELALCRRYLDIEAHRLGKRLRVDWQIDELPTGVKLPSLSLQPLLENAIYHGIQPRPDGGEICIAIRQIDRFVEVQVRNPLPTEPVGGDSGNRMALENIRERLRVLHGEAAELRIERLPGGFVVTLRCPLESIA